MSQYVNLPALSIMSSGASDKKRKENRRKVEECIQLSLNWHPWWWRHLVRWVMFVFDIFTRLTKKMLCLFTKRSVCEY